MDVYLRALQAMMVEGMSIREASQGFRLLIRDDVLRGSLDHVGAPHWHVCKG